mmetsp:Transcript_31588/g.76295  ORF Transcript_31588/g.76295 Transcript_31588/m.76295 type:complete len:109 (-) Transcript_31588:3441-3767(-)
MGTSNFQRSRMHTTCEYANYDTAAKQSMLMSPSAPDSMDSSPAASSIISSTSAIGVTAEQIYTFRFKCQQSMLTTSKTTTGTRPTSVEKENEAITTELENKFTITITI